MVNPRIVPLEAPFSAPVDAALSRIMPPGVPPLSLFRTLAVNERVFLRVMAGGLLDRGTLSLRDRELVIQRTCARLGSEYEWGVHVAFFAAKAGLGEGEIAATLAPSSLGSGPGEDPTTTAVSGEATTGLLFALVDELVDTSTVSDGLWAELTAVWTPPQLIELVALVGFYHLIAFSTNAFQLAPEPFGARFPEANRLQNVG